MPHPLPNPGGRRWSRSAVALLVLVPLAAGAAAARAEPGAATGPPYQGPAFDGFLRDHPDFAAAYLAERYAEAAALLDRPPAADDPRAVLARVYLLLAQDLLVEAWQATLREPGTHRGEVLRAVAANAARLAGRSAPGAALLRAQAIEIGLAAASHALAAEPGDLDAMLGKVLLLRAKAAQTGDPAEARALRDEADRLSARAQQEQKPLPEPGGA